MQEEKNELCSNEKKEEENELHKKKQWGEKKKSASDEWVRRVVAAYLPTLTHLQYGICRWIF